MPEVESHRSPNDDPGSTSDDQTTLEPCDSECESPVVAKMFNVFVEREYEELSYNPDVVCRAVLRGIDADDDPMSASDMAVMASQFGDVTFPNPVIDRAEELLRDDYTRNNVIVLLTLMRAHGEFHRGELDSQLDSVSESRNETREMKGFIIVDSLRVRTKQAVTHLGSKLKSIASTSKTHATGIFTQNK